MNLNIPKIDIPLSRDGKWFDFMNGVKLKISRLNTTRYVKDLRDAMLKYKDELEKEDIDSKELQSKIMAEIYADHVLHDWSGLKDENDDEIVYSRKVAIEILEDEGYVHVYNFITEKASKQANFYVEQKEEDVKK